MAQHELTVAAAIEPGIHASVNTRWRLRIGCHTDRLWGHDQWKRFPEITRAFPLQDVKNAAANPFGGLIYIEVPGKCGLGVIEVTVENSVRLVLPHWKIR